MPSPESPQKRMTTASRSSIDLGREPLVASMNLVCPRVVGGGSLLSLVVPRRARCYLPESKSYLSRASAPFGSCRDPELGLGGYVEDTLRKHLYDEIRDVANRD